MNNIIEDYLDQSDWRVKENANVSYSLGGLILHNSGALTANYWLYEVYDKKIRDYHKKGYFHLHDLSMLSTYCCGWSLKDLIYEGLNGVENKTASNPPKHLNSLCQTMINFFGVMQNESAGAQAFSSFDTYLAPFVRVDNLDFEGVKQCIQSFIFGINVASRWGSQSPFTNITIDWKVPEDLKDQAAIVGGEILNTTYGDYQKEMDMINRALIEIMLEGDSEGRIFNYPIITYNITEDFDWTSSNSNLLFKMAGKYGQCYFANFINSDLSPYDCRSMCCRLRLDKRELKKRGGGLFGAGELTGSIGVVTINMVRIGYLAKNKDQYFEMLTDVMDTAKKSLESKREILTDFLNRGLYPYIKRYLKTWQNHFSTIGLVGMNESMLNFLGKDLTNQESIDFTVEVLDFMNNKLSDYQEETGNLYNLEASPAEGTSFRLAKIDQKRYKNIKQSGEKATYYTNSTQLPVGYTDDIFHALDTQNDIQSKYTGGTVFHVLLGEAINDHITVRNLVRKIAYNYKIPYFTISPTFSTCMDHGYIEGEKFKCPKCGKKTEIYARIVGYYRPLKNWNLGKKAEYIDRNEFVLEDKSKDEKHEQENQVQNQN
jgi:ribonucleoside-triphosphate reductase